MSHIKKVVLAYSGGLDTSVIIQWLMEKYGCEVIAFAANLGQGPELKTLRKKAKDAGASKMYIEDLRVEFARDFVFPMLRAGAVYEGGYLLGTSIARPLISKKQIEIVEKEGADSVCHGSTGKGNDQIRFELAYYSLKPDIHVIAPWREWSMKSRGDLIDYAKKHGIPIPVTKKKPYSMDRNLFHISYEGGILENPWEEAPESLFRLSVAPEKAPDKPTYLEIDFKCGNPVAVNGKKLAPVKLLEALNRAGGRNGIGRLDIVENRYVGMKSRGVYETPGGTILHVARQAVESITMDRDVAHLRDSLMPKYAELVYYGYWFSPERVTMQKLFDEAAADVTGTSRVKLYKGSCTVAGRKAKSSLYREDLATFEEESVYNQREAEGFIRLNALRLKLQGTRKGRR
ncbi:MAG: argininosuccinate synthase [Thermodesulfobacteriota bacterium]